MVTLLSILFWLAVPGRIVSTAPSATEILFALGLGDKVVGVTNYCTYPPEAAKKPRIGTFLQPNMEVILGLRPDLVVIQKNPVRLGERLESMGLKTVEVDQPSLEALYASIRRIGAAAGTPDRARALESDLRTKLEAIRKKVAGRPRRRVMFVVGRNPDTIQGLVAVGGNSYLNELITIAGGKNVFEDTVAAYPKVAIEEVLARNPEVIIDRGEMSHSDASEAHRRSVIALWDKYPSIAAVKTKRVFSVNSDIFVVPGPRIVDAAREFARMLHPEAGL